MSRAGPIIIKIGGTGVERPLEAAALWRAVGDLFQRERACGRAGVVLVHGGGKAVDEHLDRLGMKTVRREGLRVTPPEQMEQIAAVLLRINKSIVGALQCAGISALGLCPGECGTAEVRRLIPGGTDIGLVGEIMGGDASFMSRLLENGVVPVFSPIGIDAAGGFLNINADDVAAGLAAVCGASRLVLLTDVPGVRGADGSIVGRLTTDDAEALIASGVISGGMVPKVRAAMRASSVAGVPVTIASWNEPHRLVELASGAAVGSTIEHSAAVSSRLLSHGTIAR